MKSDTDGTDSPLVRSPASKEGNACMTCLKVCGCICIVIVVLALWLLIGVAFGSCGIDSFDVAEVLPKNAKAAGAPQRFQFGTDENMDIDPKMNIDLTGVWWMDGNPLTFEQLVSFAGASGTLPFPSIVKNPSSYARRWTWHDNLLGRGIVAYYAWTSSTSVVQMFNFTNESYANIQPVAGVFGDNIFGFKRIGNYSTNEWDRVDTYILRRIIFGNGTAHPKFWPKFLKWYMNEFPDGKMIVKSTDSDCVMRCQYLLPCFMCNFFCR